MAWIISSVMTPGRSALIPRPGTTDLPVASAGKRGAELLYRVGDLKKWARNRPRGAVGATDAD
ncbi:hypothetical protein [Streptomyces flavovirens]|uniref:hypothetical protein n=1 Tax=Streptomyces flavovirens TaxID=52258 RepID=UPI003D0E7EA0